MFSFTDEEGKASAVSVAFVGEQHRLQSDARSKTRLPKLYFKHLLVIKEGKLFSLSPSLCYEMSPPLPLYLS